MKTIVKTLLFAAGLAAVACTTELTEEQMPGNGSGEGGLSFTASLEQADAPVSKVQWNEEGEKVRLEWSAGDEIAIYDGENVVRSANSAQAGASASFENVQVKVAEEYLAWYPYTESLGYAGEGKIQGVIPSEQYADRLNVPMFAVTETDELAFRSVCAIMMFTLNVKGVRQIVLTGKGDEVLAGEVSVDDSGDEPVISSSGNASKSIILKNSDDSALASGKDYYIAVLPQTLQEGFTLRFEGEGFSFEKVGTNPAQLERLIRLDLGTITHAQERYVANVDNNWFTVNGLDNPALTTITFETLLNGSSFAGTDAGINSVFGLEGQWLVRIGDSGYGQNQLQIATSGGNWPSSAETFSFDTDKWYHLAVVWDSQTGARKIYINGEEFYSDNRATGSIPFQTYQKESLTHKVSIGYSYSDKRPFHGCFSEMRVWNDVRTQDEIKANMMSLSDTADENLLAYWKFNEGAGNEVADHSKNERNITSAQTLSWETDVPTLTDMRFEYTPYMGSNYFPVSLKNAASLDEITVEWEMNADKWRNDANNPVSSIFGIEGYWLIRIGDQGIGDNQLQLATSGGNWTTGVYFDANRWYHVALTFNRTTGSCKVYVDGELKAENSSFASFTPDLSQNCFISKSYDDSRYIQGCLSEMRVWSVERTAEQIASNIGSLSETDRVGLMAYWKMNEGSGNTVTDHSGNGHDLTSANALTWRKTFVEVVDQPENPSIGGSEPVLEVNTEDLKASSAGRIFDLEVRCNRALEVTSSAEWCIVSLMHDPQKSEYGSLRIEVAESGEVVREASVTLSADGCEDAVISVTQDYRFLSSDCDVTSLILQKSLNPALVKDIEFEFDEREGVFSAMYLKWIDGENPEMLIPSLAHEGELFISGKQVESGVTQISFADDFTLISRAEDGTEKEYKVVFNCPQINRELPVLHMKPEQLIAGKEDYVNTDIILYDMTSGAVEGEGWWDSAEKGPIEMRGRGNSTWPLPKKPFRMKFTEKFSPIGLNHAKEKSWVILAQDMDKSLIRTHLAFEYSRVLFDASDNYHHEKCLNFTPCSKFINVYFTGQYYDSHKGQTINMDGDYLGVYQMSDQMQQAGGRIAVDKLKAEDGDDPEKITGGYIIETDLHEGNHTTRMKGIRMTYKYPEDDDFHQSQYDYITDFLNQAETALYGADYKDPENGWRKYFDEKSLADFIIIKEFVGDLDGYTSTYMYKRRGYDKIFFGPIWDCDKGWNNDKRVPHWQYQPLESLMIHAGFWMPPYVENDWFHRLWTDETFRAFVAQRWADKKEELKTVTDKVLTEMPEDMAKAIDANFTVWPFNYQHNEEANMPAEDYPSEIQRIRDHSAKREILLDRLFNE